MILEKRQGPKYASKMSVKPTKFSKKLLFEAKFPYNLLGNNTSLIKLFCVLLKLALSGQMSSISVLVNFSQIKIKCGLVRDKYSLNIHIPKSNQIEYL